EATGNENAKREMDFHRNSPKIRLTKLITTHHSPLENHLARLAGKHLIESFLEVRIIEAVSNHGREIEAALNHDGHHVPGLVHLPSIDALDSEHVENDQVP